jgi:hypothetical protein
MDKIVKKVKSCKNCLPAKRSARLFLILALVAGVSGGIFFHLNAKGQSMEAQRSQPETITCETKVYQIEAEIHVWYEDVDGEKFLRVVDEDLPKLPNYKDVAVFKAKYANLKLVDADKKLKRRLANATPKKPKTITIHGYATRCVSFPLASINYYDGIFDKFLALN